MTYIGPNGDVFPVDGNVYSGSNQLDGIYFQVESFVFQLAAQGEVFMMDGYVNNDFWEGNKIVLG